MNCPYTAVDDIRLKRKRFSISGSLLPLVLLLVLLVTQTSGRPSSTNSTTKDGSRGMSINTGDVDDSIVDATFDVGDDYGDVDNIEWHHVKIVDGIMHEDHPIIMYKEDFVNEDYDPSQQKVNSDELKSNGQRRYTHIQRQHLNRSEETQQMVQREKYHALKPEKIYFDILPPTPVVVTDDSSINDSKFDPANIRVEVISLLNDEVTGNKAHSTSIINDGEDNKDIKGDTPSKELLNKRPKKYHHRRLRRDTTNKDTRVEEHVIHKRHPHYIYQRVGSNSFDDYVKHSLGYLGQKHAVPGKKWNGIDGDVPPAIEFDNRFGGEDNTDRVIWGVSKISRPSKNNNSRRPTASPPRQPTFPPLIHDSNPNNADFSPFTTRRPVQNNNIGRPATTSRPRQPQFPPLIHNSNPDDADFSVFNSPPLRQQQDHRKLQRFGFASIPASKKAYSNKLPKDNDEADPYQNAFNISKLEIETKVKPTSELETYKEASHCEKATYTCCEMTELSSLYDCFHASKCTSSLAQIMTICA